ncbi:MAG TPA: hypothetical protein VJ508_06480, partial [Saprospiraceae bacterium]|nr:hypothetical protein [Saprospiraceae bacterium]
VHRAVQFIRDSLVRSITLMDDSIVRFSYPNYSAAYALRVLHLLSSDTILQRELADHLLREQFVENRGIQSDNLAYGGWGYGEPDLKWGQHGHVDISHTRKIAEALIESGYLVTSADRIKAIELFLKGVQRSLDDQRNYAGCLSRDKLPYDGGFISSVATLAANKCQAIQVEGAGLHYPSYATATCDGFLALYALNMQETLAYRDARQWLARNQKIDVIDGLSPDNPAQWYLIMHYYHWSVRAEAMRKAGIDGPWKEEMIKALIREQQPGGYYINPIGGVNKEDDPLMSTIFCVQAMTELSK